MEEQGGCAIGEGVNIGARRQRGKVRQGLRDVVVCAINILVFTRQDAVEPVQHMLLDRHCSCRLQRVVLWRLIEGAFRGSQYRVRTSGVEPSSQACVSVIGIAMQVRSSIVGVAGYLGWGSRQVSGKLGCCLELPVAVQCGASSYHDLQGRLFVLRNITTFTVTIQFAFVSKEVHL